MPRGAGVSKQRHAVAGRRNIPEKKNAKAIVTEVLGKCTAELALWYDATMKVIDEGCDQDDYQGTTQATVKAISKSLLDPSFFDAVRQAGLTDVFSATERNQPKKRPLDEQNLHDAISRKENAAQKEEKENGNVKNPAKKAKAARGSRKRAVEADGDMEMEDVDDEGEDDDDNDDDDDADYDDGKEDEVVEVPAEQVKALARAKSKAPAKGKDKPQPKPKKTKAQTAAEDAFSVAKTFVKAFETRIKQISNLAEPVPCALEAANTTLVESTKKLSDLTASIQADKHGNDFGPILDATEVEIYTAHFVKAGNTVHRVIAEPQPWMGASMEELSTMWKPLLTAVSQAYPDDQGMAAAAKQCTDMLDKLSLLFDKVSSCNASFGHFHDTLSAAKETLAPLLKDATKYHSSRILQIMQEEPTPCDDPAKLEKTDRRRIAKLYKKKQTNILKELKAVHKYLEPAISKNIDCLKTRLPKLVAISTQLSTSTLHPQLKEIEKELDTQYDGVVTAAGTYVSNVSDPINKLDSAYSKAILSARTLWQEAAKKRVVAANPLTRDDLLTDVLESALKAANGVSAKDIKAMVTTVSKTVKSLYTKYVNAIAEIEVCMSDDDEDEEEEDEDDDEDKVEDNRDDPMDTAKDDNQAQPPPPAIPSTTPATPATPATPGTDEGIKNPVLRILLENNQLLLSPFDPTIKSTDATWKSLSEYLGRVSKVMTRKADEKKEFAWAKGLAKLCDMMRNDDSVFLLATGITPLDYFLSMQSFVWLCTLVDAPRKCFGNVSVNQLRKLTGGTKDVKMICEQLTPVLEKIYRDEHGNFVSFLTGISNRSTPIQTDNPVGLLTSFFVMNATAKTRLEKSPQSTPFPTVIFQLANCSLLQLLAYTTKKEYSHVCGLGMDAFKSCSMLPPPQP